MTLNQQTEHFLNILIQDARDEHGLFRAWWLSDVKSCWFTALFAGPAALVHKHSLDEEAGEYGRRILSNMDETGEKPPPQARYRTQVTCLETVASWIDSCWRARSQGILA